MPELDLDLDPDLELELETINVVNEEKEGFEEMRGTLQRSGWRYLYIICVCVLTSLAVIFTYR